MWVLIETAKAVRVAGLSWGGLKAVILRLVGGCGYGLLGFRMAWWW